MSQRGQVVGSKPLHPGYAGGAAQPLPVDCKEQK
jgi:hypothetical protein